MHSFRATLACALLACCSAQQRPDGGTGLLPVGKQPGVAAQNAPAAPASSSPAQAAVVLAVPSTTVQAAQPHASQGLATASSVPTLRPGLRGVDQNGKVIELSALSGRCVVVYFYPRDATPGCTKEACAFRDVWNKYQARNVTILGVSSDDTDSHKHFAGEHGLPFSLIADTDGSWAKAFGVNASAGFYSRVSFVLDAAGRVAKLYEKVDPGVHANQILADLEAISCSSQ